MLASGGAAWVETGNSVVPGFRPFLAAPTKGPAICEWLTFAKCTACCLLTTLIHYYHVLSIFPSKKSVYTRLEGCSNHQPGSCRVSKCSKPQRAGPGDGDLHGIIRRLAYYDRSNSRTTWSQDLGLLLHLGNGYLHNAANLVTELRGGTSQASYKLRFCKLADKIESGSRAPAPSGQRLSTYLQRTLLPSFACVHHAVFASSSRHSRSTYNQNFPSR